jgi:hypothetical protein
LNIIQNKTATSLRDDNIKQTSRVVTQTYDILSKQGLVADYFTSDSEASKKGKSSEVQGGNSNTNVNI